MNLQTLTFDEAHRIVANWINSNGNYMKVSYQEEIALREALVDWTHSNRRDTEGFVAYIKERFPFFYNTALNV